MNTTLVNGQQNEVLSTEDANLSLQSVPRPYEVKLHVKNMITARCKMLVESIMEVEDIPFVSVELGEIRFAEPPTPENLNRLTECLDYYNMPLIDNHKSILVERIKAVVVEIVHCLHTFPDIKLSVYISKKLNHNYTYLANLFSEIKGITLEHFIILLKIEKVKELILYGEHSLKQIAAKLRYSSSAHLSSQFKQITGLTPSGFKNNKTKRQQPLEDL